MNVAMSVAIDECITNSNIVVNTFVVGFYKSRIITDPFICMHDVSGSSVLGFHPFARCSPPRAMAKAMKAKSTAPIAQAKRTKVERAEKKEKVEDGARRAKRAGDGRESNNTKDDGDDLSLREVYLRSDLFQVIVS